MISRDARVEPLVGGLVVVVVGAGYSATAVTGVALFVLVLLATVFTAQISLSALSLTRKRLRTPEVVTQSQMRTARVLIWSVALMVVSIAEFAYTAWLVLNRGHVTSLLGVLISGIFIVVAGQNIRAVASLRSVK